MAMAPELCYQRGKELLRPCRRTGVQHGGKGCSLGVFFRNRELFFLVFKAHCKRLFCNASFLISWYFEISKNNLAKLGLK